MSKIKTTTAYIEVPVSERLPAKLKVVIVNTDKGRQYKTSIMSRGGWDKFDLMDDREKVVSWQEKKENQVLLSKEDFLKAIGDAFDAGFNSSLIATPNKQEYLNNLIEQP